MATTADVISERTASEAISTVAPACLGAAGDTASALATWKGYVMFIGLAIVAYAVARGSLAVRHIIYQDKVRSFYIIIETFQSCVENRKGRRNKEPNFYFLLSFLIRSSVYCQSVVYIYTWLEASPR